MKYVDQCTILVVDDDEITRLMLVAVLSDICHCEVAGSAREALETLSETPVDLIVLDIHMPEVDGLAFCEKLRSNHNFVKIPVIFITSNAERATQEACWVAGGTDFVKKPIIGNTLKQRAENLLKGKVMAESVYENGYDDPLTGLKTEYYLRNEASDLLRYRQLHKQPFSMLLVKFSGIRAINHHKGFHYGNRAIQALARVISGQLGSPMRKCCRLNSASFVVTLPNMDSHQALLFSQRLTQAVGNYIFSAETTLPLNIRHKSSVATNAEESSRDIAGLLRQCRDALAENIQGEYFKPSAGFQGP